MIAWLFTARVRIRLVFSVLTVGDAETIVGDVRIRFRFAKDNINGRGISICVITVDCTANVFCYAPESETEHLINDLLIVDGRIFYRLTRFLRPLLYVSLLCTRRERRRYRGSKFLRGYVNLYCWLGGYRFIPEGDLCP